MKTFFSTLFFIFFALNVASAQTYKFEVTCTASVRFYCSIKNGCETNKDVNPSVYKVKADSPKSIKISKYVGSNNTSNWTAQAHRVDSSDKYQFVENGILTVFSITNDKKKYTYMADSGVVLYNSDLSLDKSPNENLGGQIESGSCIPN
ncbi:MAG: hypothetical protein WAO82_06390 [Limnohabitans sp.]